MNSSPVERDADTNSSLSMFILSGEELSLPFAEIRSLIEAYSEKAGKKVNSELLGEKRRIVICSTSALKQDTIQRIAQRAAFARFGGMVVSRSEKLASLIKEMESDLMLEGKSFAVDSFSIPKKEYQDLGGEIKEKTLGTVSLENPQFVFQAERVEGEFLLAVSNQGRKKDSWKTRRPRARRFFLPSAIYPKLARALVNLSRVREGGIFLDPFCGTGSLIIESEMMGISSIGIDLTRWIARGALKNMNGFALSSSILRADSTRGLPFFPNRVSSVATDVPYGRASSTRGKTTSNILKDFLSAIEGILSTGETPPAYCVVMHPSTVPLEDNNSFELVERHFLYVHRNLTRAISILRKK